MATIIEENANTTIDLADALAALEDAAQAANLATPQSAAYLAADDLPAELAQLAEWLRFYTTACLRAAGQGLWHDWNKVAMAIHRATGGSDGRLPVVPRVVRDFPLLQRGRLPGALGCDHRLPGDMDRCALLAAHGARTRLDRTAARAATASDARRRPTATPG